MTDEKIIQIADKIGQIKDLLRGEMDKSLESKAFEICNNLLRFVYVKKHCLNIYVTDRGDPNVGLYSFNAATLTLDESTVEVINDNNDMDNFKSEFKALIEKYCEPETSYDIYSDKDLEEEMAEYCVGDVRATMEIFKNAPEEPLYKDIYDSSISRKPVRNKKELKERLKKATESMFDIYGVTKESWNGCYNSKEIEV